MERVSQHSFLDICPAVQLLCCSYEENSRFVVALDKKMQEMSDFVTIKLAKGFVVSLAMMPIRTESKEEMLQQRMLGRL
jgi:hypothetical protein